MRKANAIAGGALIAGIVVIGGALAGWKVLDMQAHANQASFEPPEFVDVVVAEEIQWQPRSRLVGTVIAKRSVMLANEVVGVVTEVGFDSGEVVEAGQTLVTLDSSTERASLASAEAAVRLAQAAVEVAEAQIAAAESDVALAQNNHRRFNEAASQSSVSPTETDRINAELEKALANLQRERAARERALAELDQAKARVTEIQTVIAKKTLHSPFRARASIRFIHPGQYLGEGTDIVELTELTDDIYIDFAVPQEHAAKVTPGMVVMAKSDVLGSEAVPITVVSMDATVNPATRNVRVRSSVPNPGYRIRPGMFVDVEVPTDLTRPVVTIPATAVRRAAFGPHVYVLTPGDLAKDPSGALRAQQRMVTLGPDIGGRVIVTDGLRAGETIAASGSFKLREGCLVFGAEHGQPGGDDAAPAQGG